jgi:putative transcriptional regulator
MTKLGERLIKSAGEALAIAEGKMKPARVIAAEEIDVASIRKRLNLSQGKFAERFHLSAATIRDWEQKRRNPDRIAVNLLRIIEHAPETVERALNGAGVDRRLGRPLKLTTRRAKP